MKRVDLRIIGLGNRLRGDDGIGPAVIDVIQQKNLLPNHAEAVEATGDPLILFDLIATAKRAIIIDAAHLGMAPGTVKVVSAEQVKLSDEFHSNLHAIGLADTIELARRMGVKSEIGIVAVEPFDCGYRDGLSEPMREQIGEIVDITLKEAFRNET